MKQSIVNPEIWENENFQSLTDRQQILLLCAISISEPAIGREIEHMDDAIFEVLPLSISELQEIAVPNETLAINDLVTLADRGFIKYCGTTIELISDGQIFYFLRE